MRAPLAHDHTSWLLLVAIKRIVFSADCSPCCRRQGNDDSDIEFEEMVIDTSAEVCPPNAKVSTASRPPQGFAAFAFSTARMRVAGARDGARPRDSPGFP